MKKLNKNLILAIILISVFFLFIVSFFALGFLMRNGIIPDIQFSQAMQGVLVCIFFLPLLVSLFFFGKFFEQKRIYPLGKIFKFVSIGLFVFSVIQMILSLIGFYN